MLVSRRNLLLGSLTLPLLAQKKKIEVVRPNLLFILVDGLPAWLTGCYGNKEISTPKIDRLCRTGTRFLNGFVPAPSAIPSRNAYLTGRVSRAADVAAAPSLLDQTLSAGGYESHSVNGQAFSDSTAAASKFLDQHVAGKPFSLTVVYSGLEPPYDGVPKEFLDLYATQRFDNWPADPPARNAARGKELFGARVANLRKVAGAVSALDAEVGKLLTKLYDKQFLNDTVIVLTSTCGALLGRHGLWDGGDASDPPNMYDEVVNTPLIWSYPSRIPPSVTQVELVSAYDFIPTLCEFLLVTPPTGDFCGRSYVPLVLAKPFPKKQPWRRTVFGHYKNTDMARVDRYKLVMRDEGKGPGELYDLRIDREENQNQYDNPQFLDVRTNLAEQLTTWKKYLV